MCCGLSTSNLHQVIHTNPSLPQSFPPPFSQPHSLLNATGISHHLRCCRPRSSTFSTTSIDFALRKAPNQKVALEIGAKYRVWKPVAMDAELRDRDMDCVVVAAGILTDTALINNISDTIVLFLKSVGILLALQTFNTFLYVVAC